MSFAGLRGTGDWGANERPQDHRNMILFLDPNGSAPMYALSARARREAVTDPQFHWWEEENYVPRLGISTALVTATTAVEFGININGVGGSKGNALDLRVGDLLLVEGAPTGSTPTNEIVQVTAITTASQITIVRGFGGTTATSIGTGVHLYRIGNAFEEGSASATVSSKNPTKLTNYTQIFKTALEVTKTADATTARTGPAHKNERTRKAFDHASSIEQALLWGVASEANGPGGKPIRTTKGLLRFLSTNLTAWNDTTFTQANLLDFVSGLFDNTASGVPNQRIAFCGNKFLNKFNEIIATATNTQFQFAGVLKLYGMQMMRYVVPQGEIAFKTHPQMSQNARYNGSCIMYAPSQVHVRPLKGRDTKLQENIQNNDADTIKDQWLSELGLEVHHESLHGWAHYLL